MNCTGPFSSTCNSRPTVSDIDLFRQGAPSFAQHSGSYCAGLVHVPETQVQESQPMAPETHVQESQPMAPPGPETQVRESQPMAPPGPMAPPSPDTQVEDTQVQESQLMAPPPCLMRSDTKEYMVPESHAEAPPSVKNRYPSREWPDRCPSSYSVTDPVPPLASSSAEAVPVPVQPLDPAASLHGSAAVTGLPETTFREPALIKTPEAAIPAPSTLSIADSEYESASQVGQRPPANPYWKFFGSTPQHANFLQSFSTGRGTDHMHTLMFPRLRRYFKPKMGGLKCSPEALKMWNDPTQRNIAALAVLHIEWHKGWGLRCVHIALCQERSCKSSS